MTRCPSCGTRPGFYHAPYCKAVIEGTLPDARFEIREHNRTMPDGRIVRVKAHTRTVGKEGEGQPGG